jgi:hypothetical protein
MTIGLYLLLLLVIVVTIEVQIIIKKRQGDGPVQCWAGPSRIACGRSIVHPVDVVDAQAGVDFRHLQPIPMPQGALRIEVAAVPVLVH